MGDKPGKQPPLPPGIPREIADFVSCTKDTLTLAGGKATWLKDLLREAVAEILGKEAADGLAKYAPDPSFSFEKGAKAGSVKVTASAGVDLSLDVSVEGGKLKVDTSEIPVDKIKRGIEKWVDDLNRWLEENKKKVGGLTLDGDKVTITKTALLADAGGAIPPPLGEKKSAWSYASTAGKVAGVGVFVLATALGVGLRDAGDSTTTTPAQNVVAANDGDTGDAAAGAEPMVVDGAFCLVHGNGSSQFPFRFAVSNAPDGPYTVTLTQSPTGPVSGTGQVVDGLGNVTVNIFQFGPYDGLEIRPQGGDPIGLGPLASAFPYTVGPAPIDCSNLNEVVINGIPVRPPSTAPTALPPRQSTVSPSVTTNDVPPWSLLLIPGGGALGYGIVRISADRRRGVEAEPVM